VGGCGAVHVAFGDRADHRGGIVDEVEGAGNPVEGVGIVVLAGRFEPPAVRTPRRRLAIRAGTRGEIAIAQRIAVERPVAVEVASRTAAAQHPGGAAPGLDLPAPAVAGDAEVDALGAGDRPRHRHLLARPGEGDEARHQPVGDEDHVVALAQAADAAEALAAQGAEDGAADVLERIAAGDAVIRVEDDGEVELGVARAQVEEAAVEVAQERPETVRPVDVGDHVGQVDVGVEDRFLGRGERLHQVFDDLAAGLLQAEELDALADDAAGLEVEEPAPREQQLLVAERSAAAYLVALEVVVAVLVARRALEAEAAEDAAERQAGGRREARDQRHRSPEAVEDRVVTARRVGELCHRRVGYRVEGDQQGALNARRTFSGAWERRTHRQEDGRQDRRSGLAGSPHGGTNPRLSSSDGGAPPQRIG